MQTEGPSVEEEKSRHAFFSKAKRVVVKVGSAILTGEKGLNAEVIGNLAKDIAFLHDQGQEVILVSSGAVAAGKRKMKVVDGQELTMREKQALAAIGQSRLMHDYDEAFARYDKTIAQVLLTHSDLAHRKRYLNVRNTLLTLLELGAIPVINENDTVSTEELKFSDNDNLGALVANLIEADMFICLTDVDALYDRNPLTDSRAVAIATVPEITEDIEAMAGNSKSVLGTGGMRSKILAAKMVTAGGGSAFIGPGREAGILRRLFAGESVGTFFLPRTEKMQSRKRWIAYVLKPQGALRLDTGACLALTEKGKSLLPSGITAVEGNFDQGDAVHCLDQRGMPVAVGLANYSSAEVEKIKGLHTDSIADILGFKESDEVVHRDNLVLL
jgi:glutamate 5-kinase